MTHLLLLALSMLPSPGPGKPKNKTEDIKSSRFFPITREEAKTSKTESITYIGQMEPIVVWKARKHPDDAIRVVVLCSKEVMCNNYSNVDPITDAQFFMKRICKETGTGIELSKYKKDSPPVLQEFISDNKKLEFVLVPIDEDKVTSGIAASVDLIRNWRRSEVSTGACFWIDAHGSFRSTMTILTGVVSLLKVDEIVPDEIFSPKYSYNSEKSIGELFLADGRDAFDFFEFVSGMDDFINYGNADVLRKYFSNRNISEQERKILDAIDKIALGTQCCDTISYRAGLSELAEHMESMHPRVSSLLGIFLDYIRDSYGDLLTEKGTTLMLVKRCVEKKLYQQALTFIEASMPQEIVKKGLLIFSEDNYQTAALRNKEREKADYYLFDSFLKMGGLYSTRNNLSLHDSVKYYAENAGKFGLLLNNKPTSLREIDLYVNTRNRNFSLPFNKDKRRNLKDIPDEIFGIDSELPQRDLRKLGAFLRMHQQLKKCRNAFNHILEERPNLSDTLMLVNLYIEYADYLYRAVPPTKMETGK